MKGWARETIFVFLACLIALAIISFLIYRFVVKSPISQQECEALMSTWCGRCQLAGWEGGPTMTDRLKECVRTYSMGSERNNCNGAQADCKPYIINIETV